VLEDFARSVHQFRVRTSTKRAGSALLLSLRSCGAARSRRSEGLAIIMVVDGAENCAYDIFATPDDDFALIFPERTDIAFIEDIERRADAELCL
jgi:hypothetical protein